MALAVAAASVIFVVAIPFLGNDYLVGFGFTTFLFVAMAYGWNLISGYTGYLSFGQISFFGVGEMAVFIFILLVGYVYVWKKGALQWD